MRKNAVILMSAGLDSLAVATKVATSRETGCVILLYFTYQSRQQTQELKHLQEIHNFLSLRFPHITWELRIVPLPSEFFAASTLTTEAWSPEVDTEVRGRNLLFLSIGASIAERENCGELWAGFNRSLDGNVHADSRPEFVSNVQAAIHRSSSGRVELVAPFVNSTKTSVWMALAEAKIPARLSYSCYQGESIHCGICEACRVRRQSATWAFTDDTEYQK